MRTPIRAAALAVTVTLASLLAVPQAGNAEPVTESRPADAGQATPITLITGDTITVRTLPGGERAVSADPNGPSRGGVSLYRENDDMYAVPLVARPGIASGSLDDQLFNVDELLRSGYDDRAAAAIPVILSGTRTAARRTTRQHTLESIDAVAVSIAKKDAHDFWRGHDTAAERKSVEIDKIWLDRQVTADLTQSVPQIGAPAAWTAGLEGDGVTVAVLDTGVDAQHPDLAGRVTAAKNFSTSPGTGDNFGHGTHVAATIAGTGVRGVAPKARILNGKVLGDDGGGQLSDIIDGMEWAVDTGADIVNMSLGTSTPDNGSNPLSAAVDRLTRQSGVLFVVAAGNSGRVQGIGSPASASEALTVGAVDRSDALAGFSTRGPRIGDFAVKPEITAPGVDIVAARAAGTTMGAPVDERYTKASGTSMATPHVAGAAAILKQQHPSWTAARLKAALVTTARAATYPAAQGGAGRVDVARVTSQQAYGVPAALNLGAVPYRESGSYEPISRTVSLHNDATHDRTFTLGVSGVNAVGAATPAAAFDLPDSVTVPAGGTGQVTFTVDPNVLPIDTYYSGVLTATAADAALRFPYTIHLEPLLHEVAVSGIGRDGIAAGGVSRVTLLSETATSYFAYRTYFDADGTARARVRPGTYTLTTEIFTPDADRNWIADIATGTRPSLAVDADVSFTYDAREAAEVRIDTGRATELRGSAVFYQRMWQRGSATVTDDQATLLPADVKHLYMFPAPAPVNGTQQIAISTTLTAPVLTATARGLTLTPDSLAGAKPFDGTSTLEVADLGDGSAVARHARGKLALVTHSTEVPVATAIENAAKSGAAAVAVANRTPGRLVAVAGSQAVPAFALTGAQGTVLATAVKKQRTVRVTLTGTPYSPYQYDLVNTFRDSVPEGELRFTTDDTNTARITANMYAHGRATGTFKQASKPAWAFFYGAVDTSIAFGRPHEQWVTADPNVRYQSGVALGDTGFAMFERTWHSYTPGTRPVVDWFKQVANPTRTDTYFYQSYSSVRGNYLSVGAAPFPDSDPTHLSIPDATDVTGIRIYRGDELIGSAGYFTTTVNFDAAPGTYRTVLEATRSFDGWAYSPHTITTWTFGIPGPATGHRTIPLPRLQYHVSVDLTNSVAAGRPLTFTVQATPTAAADPAITSVRTWVSFDDGRSWTELAVAADGATTMVIPPRKRTSGYVSLRTVASDAVGHRIDQTVDRAFGLR
ncbi:S8 family peptidase [Micromonospora sp. CA-263727]|uniref:S8 family peptidase n=1 Tax=Micromonospora sp. CA-263727 TaxID=3239967 RepID=UPI003D8D0FCF